MSAKRTLWGAAIGALLAMLFVPVRYGHYVLIAQSVGEAINVPQLVLNVVFATLLGAVCANLSKRAWLWVGGCAAVVAVGAGIIAFSMRATAIAAAIARAKSDEKYAAQLQSAAEQDEKTALSDKSKYADLYHATAELDLDKARSYLHNAADNWHIAGDRAQEERLRQQEKNLSLPDAFTGAFDSPSPSPAPTSRP